MFVCFGTHTKWISDVVANAKPSDHDGACLYSHSKNRTKPQHYILHSPSSNPHPLTHPMMQWGVRSAPHTSVSLYIQYQTPSSYLVLSITAENHKYLSSFEHCSLVSINANLNIWLSYSYIFCFLAKFFMTHLQNCSKAPKRKEMRL